MKKCLKPHPSFCPIVAYIFQCRSAGLIFVAPKFCYLDVPSVSKTDIDTSFVIQAFCIFTKSLALDQHFTCYFHAIQFPDQLNKLLALNYVFLFYPSEFQSSFSHDQLRKPNIRKAVYEQGHTSYKTTL